MSPRSGTPVKLLGREDASVDWYNLEKSKRVKPFRCGEFDACIERAEASHGVPIKKREKYARREDAIIHALELEKQYLERQQQKYGTNSNALSHKYFGNLKKMMNSCPSSGLQLRDNEPMNHSEPVNSELQSQTGRVDWPAEGLEGIPVHVQMGKHSKQMNWEDRNSALLPFTRGLQDFGLHMASSKRKQPSSAPCESSQPALFDNHVDDIPDSRHSIEGVNDTGGVKNSMGIKRKRLHGALMEESPVKRRDMRRPFVQVLQNGIKLPAKSLQGNFEGTSDAGKDKKEQIGAAYDASSSDHCNHTGHSSDQMQMSSTESGYSNHVHQPGPLAGEDASSGLIGEGETSSSEGDYLVADLDEETALNEDAKSFIHGSRNLEGHASKGVSVFGDQEKLEKMSDEYDMLLSDHEVHIVSKDWAAGTDDIGLSKWHMKGKRNIRNLARKSMEVFDGKDSVMSSDNCCGSLNGSVERKRCSFKTGWEGLSGQGLYHKDDELNYVYEDDDVFEKDNRLLGFGNHSYPLMLKAASRDHIIHGINDSDEDSHKIFPSVWEEPDEPPHLARSYWGESDEFLDAHFIHPVNIDMAPRLVDVNLKVQASCQRREHVPLVSLMSRLNGKAIIGHPVHIEILEDGSTDFLCPRNHLGVNATAVDELAAPTAWRTGKRTAMQRVPRAHLVKSLQGEESEFIPYSNGEGRPPFKKSFAAPTSWTSVMKSSSHHKFHKKPSKKRSLPSQKSRTLYTIAMKKWDHVNASAKHWRKEGSILDGLIKPSSAVPLVTCVPVKVVFTRILEVVGGPPSASMTHGASTG